MAITLNPRKAVGTKINKGILSIFPGGEEN